MLRRFWNGVMIKRDELEGMVKEKFVYYMELESASDGKLNWVEGEGQFEFIQVPSR
jgi:hypothetical protein